MLHNETLTATTSTIGMGGITIPCTITLHSTSATRKIEVSTNSGTDYFEPTKDIETAAFILTTIGLAITNIKITGSINDTFTVVGA